MNAQSSSYDGGCTCRFVRYRMTSKPLFVHCCHCRWCQRETGTSLALNALIEAERVQLLQGEVAIINTPSHSGKGQKISRCPRCHQGRVFFTASRFAAYPRCWADRSGSTR